MARDQLGRLRALGRLAQLLVGCVRIADAQVLGDRAVEQQRLLIDHADIVAQRRELHGADVHAVDFDRAGLRIERAMQQRERGRLAGAGGADERDGLARQHRERKVRDGGALAVIGERHIGELDQRRSRRTSRPASRTSSRRSTTPSSRSPTSTATWSRGRAPARAASRARASRRRSPRSSPPKRPRARRMEHGMRSVAVFVKGPGAGRETRAARAPDRGLQGHARSATSPRSRTTVAGRPSAAASDGLEERSYDGSLHRSGLQALPPRRT